MTEDKAFSWVTNEDIGVSVTSGKTLVCTELFGGESVRSVNGTFQTEVEPYSCVVMRLKVVDAK